MSINIQQLRDVIVKPALEAIGLYSIEAEALVLGTGAVESGYRYLKQVRGPALGFWQMEPATHDDHWDNWIINRRKIHHSLACMLAADLTPDRNALSWNLRYAAAMCRIHYRRKPGALPGALDVSGQAHYWKEHYNTYAGKGTTGKYIKAFEMVRGTVSRSIRSARSQ